VVLHELAHLFLRRLFGPKIVTPELVGYRGKSGKGESGYDFEKVVVGGVGLAQWGNEREFPNLANVTVLVMEQDGVVFEICNVFRLFISEHSNFLFS
jgi:hypothetical protein